jgi:hypothetical protein
MEKIRRIISDSTFMASLHLQSTYFTECQLRSLTQSLTYIDQVLSPRSLRLLINQAPFLSFLAHWVERAIVCIVNNRLLVLS